jgi:hypothetical protein
MVAATLPSGPGPDRGRGRQALGCEIHSAGYSLIHELTVTKKEIRVNGMQQGKT